MRSKANPPRWAESLLRGLLPAREQETISGDLLEEYREAALPSRGRWRASFWYLRQTLSFADSSSVARLIGRMSRARPAQACFVALLVLAVIPLSLRRGVPQGSLPAIGVPVELRGKVVRVLLNRQEFELTMQVSAAGGDKTYRVAAARGALPRNAMLPGDELIVTGSAEAGEILRAEKIVKTGGQQLYDRGARE